MPSSVTSIGKGVFSDCTSLAQIYLSSTLTTLRSYTFSGCSLLQEIVIPFRVQLIDDFCFSGCISLARMTIPSLVTSIGSHAFFLKEIMLSSSPIQIGELAFFNCTLDRKIQKQLTKIYGKKLFVRT